jgi:tetrapyrrole methylase family protein/MazG family protein
MAKAARVGFTWSHVDDAAKKVNEELAELEEALRTRKLSHITEELGDTLFALVNLARFTGANPEDALHLAVGKFIKRFGHIEKTATRQKKELSQYSLEELVGLWNEAKQKSKRKPAAYTRPKKSVAPSNTRKRPTR